MMQPARHIEVILVLLQSAALGKRLIQCTGPDLGRIIDPELLQ